MTNALQAQSLQTQMLSHSSWGRAEFPAAPDFCWILFQAEAKVQSLHFPMFERAHDA